MTTIDLAPTVNQVVLPLLSAGLLGVLTWALQRAGAFFHMQIQDSQRALLSAAITNGIAYAQQLLAGRENVTLGDKAAAAAAYVIPKVPGAMKALGVTPDHLEQLVTSQLPQASVPQQPS